MSTMRITIVNPKAEKLLKNLEELKLIEIQDNSNNGFVAVLEEFRSKAKAKSKIKQAPSLAEITREVEIVRRKRHAKKG